MYKKLCLILSIFTFVFFTGCGGGYSIIDDDSPVSRYQFSINDDELADIELDLTSTVLDLNFSSYSSKEQQAAVDILDLIDNANISYMTVDMPKKINESYFDDIKLEDKYDNYKIYIFKGSKGYSLLIYDSKGGLGTYYEFN